MTFPQTPLPVRVRIAPGADPGGNPAAWNWVEITNDVRVADGIDIEVGKPDEGKAVDPGKCTLVINNKNGKYSTRNPTSPYSGQLARNCPLDVDVAHTVTDTFTRAVTGGWGQADSGDAWTCWWYTSGPGSAADFAVSGGVGRFSIGGVPDFRIATLSLLATDVDMYATVTTTAAVPTGAPIEPLNLLVRLIGTTGYMFRAEVETSGAVTAFLYAPGGAMLTSATVTGLTYTPGMSLRGRFSAVGATLSAKVWNAANAEPAAWTLTVTDSTYLGPGGIGVRSGIATGNTNARPVVFSYDNISASTWCNRFTGTVPEWPPRWDSSGKDAYVPITAGGIKRRLSQGAAPLRSTLFRSAVSHNPAAYWSLEEEPTSSTFAEALGRIPMTWSGGAPKRGTGGPPGSAPLVTLAADTQLVGRVAPYPASSWWGAQLVFKVPDAQGQDMPILDIYLESGTYQRWRLWYGYNLSRGSVYWVAYDRGGNPTANLGATGLQAFPDGKGWGHDIILGFNVHQSGGNILLDGAFASPDDPAGERLTFTASIPGTNGNVTQVVVPWMSGYPHTDWVYGHILIMPGQFTLFDRQMYGYSGEKAADRFSRLCAEEGVQFTVRAGDSAPMGPQPLDTFVHLLEDCEAADSGGLLYEVGTGFGYVPRTARYNPPVAMALDFSAGHIAAPPEPTDDDQLLRNDITCKRPNGSSGRYIDTTSNNAVKKVGRYDEEVTVNVQTDSVLLSHAAWRVHLGTVDEMRWPLLELNLAAPGAVSLIPTWLGVGLGARITAAHPPVEGTRSLLDLLLEGYREHLNVYDWTVSANCSQASPWRVFVVGRDRVDGDGYQLAVDADATTPTLSVKSTTGRLWGVTGDPQSSFPFDIEVAGIRLRVTGISGTVSPQTFTVQRSMDGFDKPLPAGAAVRLWKPAAIAL